MKLYVILAGAICFVTVGTILFLTLDQKTDAVLQNNSEINHAKHFQIYKINNKKILVDGAQRKLDVGINSIKIPAERLVLFSSTHVAFLDKLNQTEKIVGIAWANTYDWYIPNIEKRFAEKTIVDIGTANNPNYDIITSLKPDLVFLVGGAGMWETHAKKLDEIGIDYVIVSEWMEEDPVGKFEWIKFFGFLTDSYDLAEKIFSDELNDAEKISQKTKNNEKPTVLWAGIFNGIAFVPRMQSYPANAVIDANANYVFLDLNGTGSAQISLEELLVRAKNAQIMVYSGAFLNHTDQIVSQYPILSKIRPIQECNVYSFQPWYWQATDEYGMFAADMAAIAHPDTFADYQLQLFKKAECI
jgi:iron complex transport system substrate-binding protein